MKRTLLISIVTLFVLAPFPAEARRPLLKPEPLTFKKTYRMPGMGKKELDLYLYRWGRNEPDLGDVTSHSDYHSYIKFYDRKYKKKIYTMRCYIAVRFRDEEFDLDIYKTCAFGLGDRSDLSSHDDEFNRSKWWLMCYRRKMEAVRAEAAKLFDSLCASLEAYMAEGPPAEMSESG